MNRPNLEERVKSVGAILTNDHFVYTKGGHGSAYVDKDRIYPHPDLVAEITYKMAVPYMHTNIEVVVGPAMGGIILSTWVGYHLTQLCNREVLSFYAEKSPLEGGFELRRGGVLDVITGKRVLVVEDILNTGGSVKDVVHAVRNVGGSVVGVSAIVNRGGVTREQVGNIPHLTSVFEISLQQWSADECPLCRDKVPINTSVGKGRDFLAETRGGP